MRSVLALLCKNALIKRRRFVQELWNSFVAPAMLSFMLIQFTATGSITRNIPSQDTTYDPSQLSVYFTSGLPWGRIAFVGSNETVSKITANIPFPQGISASDATIRFDTRQQLFSYCNQDKNSCFGGVEFANTSGLSTSWAYTIWVDTSLVAEERKDKTNLNDLKPFQIPSFLQKAIDDAILKTYNVPNFVVPTVSIQEIYSETGTLAAVTSFISYWSFAMYVTLFSGVMYTYLQGTLIEKESRLKESMLMMGLAPIEYTVSWFITCFLQCFVPWIGIMYCFLLAFPHANLNFTNLTIVSGLTGISTLLLAYLVESFLSNSRTGPFLGLVIMLLLTTIFASIENSIRVSGTTLLILSSLLTPVSWWLGTAYVFQLIIPADLLNDRISGITFPQIITTFVIQILLYMFLGWYLSQVVPQPWGSPKHPFFLFQASYWRPKISTAPNAYVSFENQDIISEPLRAGTQNEIGISIRNLTKIFKHPISKQNQTAVANLNLDIQKGSVLALLGRNGAGKTTIISMLTGLLKATSGDAILDGISILHGGARQRGLLGVCPQVDTIFPTLTVAETLRLFARIKRVPIRDINAQVNAMLESTGLLSKANTLAGSLSGGQKRRMLVGVAFIGGSRLVILDEMSSGVDPVSRRALWEIVNKNRKDRTIILTTHFLDEAEALSDRIAIIAEGHLRCVGSSMFLKKEFGAGYNVTVMVKESTLSQSCVNYFHNLVKDYAPDAELISAAGSELQFHLSEQFVANFSAMIKHLDGEPKIYNFGISITTLDEVFMRASNLEDMRKTSNAIRNQSLDEKSVSFSAEECGIAEHRSSAWTQTTVMMGKIFRTAVRDKYLLAARILLPIGAAALSAYMMRNDPSYLKCQYAQPDSSPSAQMLLSEGIYVYPANQASAVQAVVFGVANVTGFADADSETQFIQKFKDNQLPPMLTIRSLTDYTVVVSSSTTDQDLSFILQNIMTNALLQKNGASKSIEINAMMQRMSGTPQIEWNFFPIDQIYLILAMVIFCLPGVLGVKFLIAERISGAKYQQYVSGLHPISYWVSQFLFDQSIVILSSIGATAVFFIFKTPNMTGDCVMLFASICLFGFASTTFGYVTTHVSSTVSSSLTLILSYYFAVGFIGYSQALGTAIIQKSMLPMQSDTSLYIHFAFGAVSPTTAFYWSQFIYSNLLNFRCNAISPNNSAANLAPISQDIWKPLVIMAAQTGIYFIIAVMIDILLKSSDSGRPKRKRFLCRTKATDYENINRAEPSQDVDVIDEMLRLPVPQVGDKSLILREVTKKYGDFEAVKGVSLHVPQGTCFALLGSNGCGKSSTFEIISAKKRPTTGNAFVNGFDSQSQTHMAHAHMGYCPQVDALPESLSVQETIAFFAKIKGVNSEKVPQAVEALITRLDLQPHAEKLIAHLSGGNKRKVSAAVALVGCPSVVLLDEPSTGMDAVSKRRLWDVIASLRKYFAVVLTTHSMEEAEAISNRMAIMSGGKLRCIGTMHQLTDKFSSEYEVDIILRDPLINIQNLGFAIRSIAISPIDDNKIKLKVYNSSEKGESTLANLFEKCEALKRNGVILEYRISPPTLEQIFMNVIHESEMQFDGNLK